MPLEVFMSSNEIALLTYLEEKEELLVGLLQSWGWGWLGEIGPQSPQYKNKLGEIDNWVN